MLLWVCFWGVSVGVGVFLWFVLVFRVVFVVCWWGARLSLRGFWG